MIFARIGSGPCYKHCNEICAGVKMTNECFLTRKIRHFLTPKGNFRRFSTSIGSKCGVADSMASTAVAGLAAGKHSTGWLAAWLVGRLSGLGCARGLPRSFVYYYM